MSHPPIEQQVTFFYTRDLPATARFYEQIIGLALALDQGNCRIYRVSSSGFLGFCHNNSAPRQPQGVIFTLATHHVDRWYTYLREQGVTIEQPPTHNSTYNIYHFFLRDPNGYLLEIQQFLAPEWPAP